MTEHRPMAVGGSDPDPWTQSVTLQTYTLELIGPRRYAGPFPLQENIAPKHLREMEENLTDLLPPGYRAVIREWDEEEK